MTKSAARAAVLAALLLIAALPAAAIPYCWNCTCSSQCTSKCWNGTAVDTCAHWLCVEYCFPGPQAAVAQDDLFAEPVDACGLTAEAAAVEAPAEQSLDAVQEGAETE